MCPRWQRLRDSILVGEAFSARDIVVGDNGTASFDVAGVLVSISTLVPATGGDDDILVGDGADVVFGGAGAGLHQCDALERKLRSLATKAMTCWSATMALRPSRQRALCDPNY